MNTAMIAMSKDVSVLLAILKEADKVKDFKWLKLAVWSDQKTFSKWIASPMEATYRNRKHMSAIIRQVSFSLLRAAKRESSAMALIIAAIDKEHDLIKLLLLVPDIYTNATNKYYTTTHSVLTDSVEIAIVKLVFGDPRNRYNEDYHYAPALLEASNRGDWEIVKLLLSAGANVNCTGHRNLTPLLVATIEGHENIVELLLISPGININHKDYDGLDAPMYARRRINILNLLNNFELRPHATVHGILIKLLTESNENTLSHVLENTSNTEFPILSSPAVTSTSNGKNNIQSSNQLAQAKRGLGLD